MSSTAQRPSRSAVHADGHECDRAHAHDPQLRRSSIALLSLFLVTQACASAEPAPVVRAYQAAIERRDARALWLASSGAQRQLMTEADIAAALAADAAGADALAAELGGLSAVEVAELQLASGRRVRLIREEGQWRIDEGGIDRLFDRDPLAALSAFVRAVDRDRLERVREAIPRADRARFAEDAALRAHVSAMSERIAALRAALPGLGPGAVSVDGDGAEVRWGEGRVARLVREDGRWRILDLE